MFPAAMLCLAPAACASREVPATFPERSAASLVGAAAPSADVTQSLDTHPPLPGEASSGWAGLSGPVEPAAHEHGAAESSVVYSCPMHPDVVSDGPGQCPRCGMALVKRDAPKE